MLRFVVRRLLARWSPCCSCCRSCCSSGCARCPGGPVSAFLGERATPSRRAALEAALGLDQPIHVQYLQVPRPRVQRRLRRLHPGAPREDALEIFLARLPATIELALLRDADRDRRSASRSATSPPAGAARPLDNAAVDRVSLVGVAVPVFFLAFLLKYFFAVQWQLLPASGRQDASTRRHPRHRLLRARRHPHPRVGRRLGRAPAPGAAGDRAGHHPVRGDLPDHPGLGARRARRGLRAHRRVQGPDHRHDPQPARAAQRDAAGGHHHRPAGRRRCWPGRCSPRRSSPAAGIGTRSPTRSARRTIAVLQVLILAAPGSSCWSTCSSTSPTRSSTPGSGRGDAVSTTSPDPGRTAQRRKAAHRRARGRCRWTTTPASH